jgi:hypothetical protein
LEERRERNHSQPTAEEVALVQQTNSRDDDRMATEAASARFEEEVRTKSVWEVEAAEEEERHPEMAEGEELDWLLCWIEKEEQEGYELLDKRGESFSVDLYS